MVAFDLSSLLPSRDPSAAEPTLSMHATVITQLCHPGWDATLLYAGTNKQGVPLHAESAGIMYNTRSYYVLVLFCISLSIAVGGI